MIALTALIFFLVYLGLVAGRLPGVGLDRSGMALLGAIALLATGAVDETRAMAAIDVPTIALLFGLMVLSAQLRLGGFYSWVVTAVAACRAGPTLLLLLLILAIGMLAAVFSNDIICLAATPVLIALCRRRRLPPVPFLLGLAMAANIGSGATLIGNPQNILIGEVRNLSFRAYLLEAGPLALFGLLAAWAVLAWQYRHRWQPAADDPTDPPQIQPFSPWKTGKGLCAALALLLLFLGTDLPRDLCALAVAGILLVSRRLTSRAILSLVDWQLLLLFVSLFILNDAIGRTGLPALAVDWLAAAGIDLGRPAPLITGITLLSNAVSNVPAVILLLPLTESPHSGTILALASTFAGNLFLVGSIANIIVSEEAARAGITLDWRTHCKSGIPITLLTLLLVWLRYGLVPAPP
ncbi:MAG: SLC13 family permease [Thermodesulfobacteriota bacterium]